MHVIPIASGKGGVGKSLLAANLSIALGQAGKSVILADLDLGASNLHLILGVTNARQGIGTFLSGKGERFEDIIVQTEYKGLRFIPGDSEIPGMANVKPGQKRNILRKLLSLDADYLVLDLGAGTASNILDFFLCSGQGIIVTAPTLTATLNAYLFLKNAVFRLMYTSFKPKSTGYAYLEQLRKEGNSLQRAYIPKILEQIALIDPEGYAHFDEELKRFKPRLVMNMLEDPKDAEKAQKIRRSCTEYLGIDLEHLGIIYRDDLQDIALASRLPIIAYKPNSVLAQAIYRIADKLIQVSLEDDAPLNPDMLDDSYTEASLEAEVDFNSKISYVEELLQSGTLSEGDLVEMVKMQQFEINQIKKENQLLKHRLANAINAGFRP